MDCVKCCLHYFYIRSCDRTTNCPGCTLTPTAGVSSVDPVTLRSVTLMLTLSPNPFEAAVLFSSLRRRKIKVPSCKIHNVGFLWAIDRLAHSSQCTLHFNAKVPQTVLKDCFMQARPGTGLCFCPSAAWERWQSGLGIVFPLASLQKTSTYTELTVVMSSRSGWASGYFLYNLIDLGRCV